MCFYFIFFFAPPNRFEIEEANPVFCLSFLIARCDEQCSWCPALSRCSTGTDRKRQNWLQSGCDRTMLKDPKVCPALGSKGNNYDEQHLPDTLPSYGIHHSSQNTSDTQKPGNTDSVVKKSALSHADTAKTKPTNPNYMVGIMLPMVVVLSMIMWVFYAYRNPHTKSGQLLIQVSCISFSVSRKTFGIRSNGVGIRCTLINKIAHTHTHKLIRDTNTTERNPIESIRNDCGKILIRWNV